MRLIVLLEIRILLFKVIRNVIIDIKSLFTYLERWIKAIRLFYFPNIKRLNSGLIYFDGNWPICSQRTLLSGKGKIKIGTNCQFGYTDGGFNYCGTVEIQARYLNSVIVIGNSVATNNNIFICCANEIRIGNNTLIGQMVTIMDHEAHGIHPGQRNNIGEIGKVNIANNVWIGNNVIILKNTEIGENSIVAAGAVVSGSFPNNVIIGGVPARIIKNISE